MIDLYFKLCSTNMLHKKQIIHKINNEMTDRREMRIIYCQLNVLCSRVRVSIHTKVKFHPFLGQSLVLKEYSVGLKKKKRRKRK